MTNDAPTEIDISLPHLQIVRRILQYRVPQREVWAFGSRVKGTARPYSDLDLAVLGDEPLSLEVHATLRDDLSNSDLPWNVDVVDWATTGEKFREIIRQQKIVLQKRWERVGFLLQVKRDRLDEYRARHREVWPDMLAALSRTGWCNYSLFLHENGTLFGYFETPDLQAALDGMAATEVNARWQAEMAPFFEGLDGRAPDEGFLRLEEVFHLE